MKKILYVEDEPFLGKIVKETLEKNNFEVRWILDGKDAIKAFESFIPDICILDVMLPNLDGFSIGKAIRKIHHKMPIIFLTAKVQHDDVIEGFTSGGTDYLKKPFNIDELIARINSQLFLAEQKSSTAPSNHIEEIKIGKYCFNPNTYELTNENETIKLSLRDAQVLQALVNAKDGFADRKKLLLEIWGDDSYFNSRNLDVYILKLRQYFKYDSNIEIITLKGKGYQFAIKNMT